MTSLVLNNVLALVFIIFAFKFVEIQVCHADILL